MSKKKEVGFEITQERIDVINTAIEYLHKFIELEKWVDENFMVIMLDNVTGKFLFLKFQRL